MRKPRNQLTALAVSRLKQNGKYAVGEGAYLQIGQGTRSWLFRYKRDGKTHWMGLGPASLVSLAEAREKAREGRRQLLGGIDPLAAKSAARAQASLDAAKSMTFKDCADAYAKAHEAGWRNSKHKAQWPASLRDYGELYT